MYPHAGSKCGSRCCTSCRAGAWQDAETAGPDISLLDPILQKQWDHAANKHLGQLVIPRYSNRKVWWQCDRCPDGHPHSWAAMVKDRSHGSGCPYCVGQEVCKHNSLATKHPLVAAEWHPTSNAFSPQDVTASSGKSAVWQCRACSHVWTTPINNWVQQGQGCPHCNTGVYVIRAKKRHPTLADSNHPLLAEWDHLRNAALGIVPHNTTRGSGKKVFWLCSNCPAGQEHSYSAPPYTRTRRQPSGCPYCAGKKACKCNSLRTLYPQLALEWDFAKNVGRPDDHTAHSRYMAWWTSPNCNSWQQSIYRRAKLVNEQSQRRFIKQHGL